MKQTVKTTGNVKMVVLLKMTMVTVSVSVDQDSAGHTVKIVGISRCLLSNSSS